jgi:hypothetical protein
MSWPRPTIIIMSSQHANDNPASYARLDVLVDITWAVGIRLLACPSKLSEGLWALSPTSITALRRSVG